MDKKYTIGIAVVVVLFLVAFFMLQEGEAPISVVSAQATPLADSVSILSQDKTHTIKDVEKVAIGDTVETNSSGKALIEGEHDTFLDSDSSLTIKEFTTGKSNFELLFGRLWARTKKTVDKGEYFEIETKNVRAAVRGTSFGVKFINGRTDLFVTEGLVAVVLRDETTGAILSYTEVILSAGEKVSVYKGEIKKGLIDTKDEKDPWFIENNPNWKEPPRTSTENASTVTNTTQTSQIFIPAPKLPVETVQKTDIQKFSSSVTIDSVIPSTVTVPNSSTLVTISGKGFLKVKAVVVGKITLRDFKTVNDTKVQFSAEVNGIAPGVYDISMVDLGNAVVIKSKALTVVLNEAGTNVEDSANR